MATYRIRIDTISRSATVKIKDGKAVWTKPRRQTIEVSGAIDNFHLDDETLSYSSQESGPGRRITAFVETLSDINSLPINVTHGGHEFAIESDVHRLEHLAAASNDYLLPLREDRQP